jgi:glutathione S-transferase
MTTTLWHLRDSHFSEKVRWALDLKRVPHGRRTPPPGLHQLVAARLTPGHRTLPILVLDGQAIRHSATIVATLDERFPDPPLMPADPPRRARALALQDFADAELAPYIRRYSLFHLLQDTELVVAVALPGAGAAARRAMAAALPPLRHQLYRTYDVTPATVAVAHGRLLAALDRLEAELDGRPHLVGDAFTVADLASAAMLGPLLRPAGFPTTMPWLPAPVAELKATLEAREAGRWAIDTYERHRHPGRSGV